MNKSLIPRTLSEKILSLAKMFPVVTLSGPRQSGKTTLCRFLFPAYKYVNLENIDDRMAAEEDPRHFLQPYAETGIVIDEAQKVPALFSYLQGIVDESQEMGKYILTGSQNYLLLEKITQSLAGRIAICNLFPFDTTELAKADLLKNDLNHAMFTGGYPVLYDRHVPERDYFPSYIQTYIERDVRNISRIGDLSIFQKFVKLCAGRTGQLLNLSALGNELSINYKTVRSWISILEASYIVFLLQPHHQNFNKRLVKQPKLYFYDTGLLCALLNIQNPDQLDSHYSRGSLFENYVISEYIKSCFHEGQIPDVYFWRNSTGHEIDLLIEEGNQVRAAEIKSGETLNEDFFKGLKYYKKLSSIPDENCFLVYGGNQNTTRRYGQVIGWQYISRLRS